MIDMELVLVAIIVTIIVAVFTTIFALFTGKLKPRIYNFFEKQGIKGPEPKFPFGTKNDAWKKDLGENDLENVKKYGKVFGTFDGVSPNLIISDPELIKNILENDYDKFQSYRAFRVKQSVLRHSLLGIEGRHDKELKEILNIAFGEGKIKKLFPRISKAAETFVQHVLQSITEDSSLNISEEASSYINDTIAFSLFGLDLNADNIVREKFHKALNKVFTVDNPDSFLSVTPFTFESLGSLDNFVFRPTVAKYLTSLIELVVEERKKMSDIKPEGRAVDLIDLLQLAAEEEKQKAAKDKNIQEENLQTLLSKDQFINVCLEIILTVSRAAKSTLALSVHTLACNPEIQEKLVQGVEEHMPNHKEIGYRFIKENEYLDMFMGEILRLYPIEYRLERKCINEVVWGELKVNPGQLVSVPIYAIHRLPEFYPDPEKFQPERFSEENSKKRNHFTYLPFGQAGADSDHVGVQLGVLFTKLALIRLINEIKILKDEKTKEQAEFVKGITGVPLPKPIWVKVEKREWFS